MWVDVLARFEKKAPVSVMAKLALEQAIAPEYDRSGVRRSSATAVLPRIVILNHRQAHVPGFIGPAYVIACCCQATRGSSGQPGSSQRQDQLY